MLQITDAAMDYFQTIGRGRMTEIALFQEGHPVSGAHRREGKRSTMDSAADHGEVKLKFLQFSDIAFHYDNWGLGIGVQDPTGNHIQTELLRPGHLRRNLENRLSFIDPFHQQLSAVFGVHGVIDITGGQDAAFEDFRADGGRGGKQVAFPAFTLTKSFFQLVFS